MQPTDEQIEELLEQKWIGLPCDKCGKTLTIEITDIIEEAKKQERGRIISWIVNHSVRMTLEGTTVMLVFGREEDWQAIGG
uniref:Uncharacterized protein n=1 Tax=viral metagenome TaxID=1070528 RepID=A0A6M3JJ92_9ZZZZ